MSTLHQTPQELLAADSHARHAALDPTRSFIIDAPAGAGKTELLTQRFLVLLTQVDEPEEIIALTFTNKAAAEMRDRIMRSLLAATQPEEPNIPAHKRTTRKLAIAVLERHGQRQWQLLDQPGRLRVMTLDALSARIARQMPLLSRFGTQPAIAAEPAPLYEQAARNTLDLLEDGTADSDIVAHALSYFDNDAGRLQRMLISMLARRDQWLGHAYDTHPESLRADVSQVLHALIRQRLLHIAQRISPARQQTFMDAARYAAELSPDSPIHLLADWHTPLTADPRDLPHWRALADLFLTGKDELRKVFQKPINLAGAKHQAQKQTLLEAAADFAASGDAPVLADIRALPDPQLDEGDAILVTHLAALLKLANAQLWLVFIREKSVDFSEIAMKALAALGEEDAPSEIHEHLDYRLRHLLIDEFQDTSPLQVRLLEKLTSGWESDPSRSIFLVGDPMQSIYRFRKADVGLFLRIRQNGLGGLHPTHLQLYLNNRSYSDVITWINDTFQQVFAPEEDIMKGAVTYAPSVANKGASPQAGVTIHPIISGRDANETQTEEGAPEPRSVADEREAATIIELIHNARRDNPSGTIAVLVRARSHLDALIRQLQAAEPRLPFQAVEIDALAARQPIQDLVSLTRALFHRADRVHWLAILRAPWCGLTLKDLHALAADDHQQTLWQLMQDEARLSRLTHNGRARLLPFRSALTEAFTYQALQRPRRWIEGVWHALGGPACLRESSDVDDVSAYFHLLDSLDDRGALNLDQLDDALGRLFAAPEASLDSRHIQLMTIHKSKGLEFDTVILPGLHRTPPPDEKTLLLWDNTLLDDGRTEHLVVAPAPAPGAPESTIPTPYDLLRNFERTRRQNEDRRVLYVAVTRAIRRLHLLGIAQRDTPSDDPDKLKPPANGALLSALWPTLAANFIEAARASASPAHTPSPLDPASFVPKLLRIAAPRPIAPLPAEETFPELDQALFSSTLDMDVGTVIHQYLEAFATDGLDAWPAERVAALCPRFVERLEALGHAPEDTAASATLIHDTLQNVLRDELGRWILAPHDAAGCEVPLSSLGAPEADLPDDPPEFRHHVIDRTFIDQGIRWIIDYKTHRVTQSADLEAMLQAKAESYRPQLARYSALYAHEAAQGMTIRTAIFFPAHGKLITI